MNDDYISEVDLEVLNDLYRNVGETWSGLSTRVKPSQHLPLDDSDFAETSEKSGEKLYVSRSGESQRLRSCSIVIYNDYDVPQQATSVFGPQSHRAFTQSVQELPTNYAIVEKPYLVIKDDAYSSENSKLWKRRERILLRKDQEASCSFHPLDRAEKTTYCRPLHNYMSPEYLMYKSQDKNDRIRNIVNKLVEVKRMEKKREVWNNFINDLKTKHGINKLQMNENELIDSGNITFDMGASTASKSDKYDVNHVYNTPSTLLEKQSKPTVDDFIYCQMPLSVYKKNPHIYCPRQTTRSQTLSPRKCNVKKSQVAQKYQNNCNPRTRQQNYSNSNSLQAHQKYESKSVNRNTYSYHPSTNRRKSPNSRSQSPKCDLKKCPQVKRNTVNKYNTTSYRQEGNEKSDKSFMNQSESAFRDDQSEKKWDPKGDEIRFEGKDNAAIDLFVSSEVTAERRTRDKFSQTVERELNDREQSKSKEMDDVEAASGLYSSSKVMSERKTCKKCTQTTESVTDILKSIKNEDSDHTRPCDKEMSASIETKQGKYKFNQATENTNDVRTTSNIEFDDSNSCICFMDAGTQTEKEQYGSTAGEDDDVEPNAKEMSNSKYVEHGKYESTVGEYEHAGPSNREMSHSKYIEHGRHENEEDKHSSSIKRCLSICDKKCTYSGSEYVKSECLKFGSNGACKLTGPCDIETNSSIEIKQEKYSGTIREYEYAGPSEMSNGKYTEQGEPHKVEAYNQSSNIERCLSSCEKKCTYSGSDYVKADCLKFGNKGACENAGPCVREMSASRETEQGNYASTVREYEHAGPYDTEMSASKGTEQGTYASTVAEYEHVQPDHREMSSSNYIEQGKLSPNSKEVENSASLKHENGSYTQEYSTQIDKRDGENEVGINDNVLDNYEKQLMSLDNKINECLLKCGDKENSSELEYSKTCLSDCNKKCAASGRDFVPKDCIDVKEKSLHTQTTHEREEYKEESKISVIPPMIERKFEVQSEEYGEGSKYTAASQLNEKRFKDEDDRYREGDKISAFPPDNNSKFSDRTRTQDSKSPQEMISDKQSQSPHVQDIQETKVQEAMTSNYEAIATGINALKNQTNNTETRNTLDKIENKLDLLIGEIQELLREIPKNKTCCHRCDSKDRVQDSPGKALEVTSSDKRLHSEVARNVDDQAHDELDKNDDGSGFVKCKLSAACMRKKFSCNPAQSSTKDHNETSFLGRNFNNNSMIPTERACGKKKGCSTCPSSARKYRSSRASHERIETTYYKPEQKRPGNKFFTSKGRKKYVYRMQNSHFFEKRGNIKPRTSLKTNGSDIDSQNCEIPHKSHTTSVTCMLTEKNNNVSKDNTYSPKSEDLFLPRPGTSVNNQINRGTAVGITMSNFNISKFLNSGGNVSKPFGTQMSNNSMHLENNRVKYNCELDHTRASLQRRSYESDCNFSYGFIEDDSYMCAIVGRPFCNDAYRDTRVDKIMIEELDKSDQAKRDIEDILKGEGSRSAVKPTVDEPTRDDATEVTSSLYVVPRKKSSSVFHSCVDQSLTTIAVNTEPLGVLTMLSLSASTTVRRLFGLVSLTLPIPQALLPLLPQLTTASLKTIQRNVPDYLCNICGIICRSSEDFNVHRRNHAITGPGRDCNVCKHLLDLRKRRTRGFFTCAYCEKLFTRAYCCELHQCVCARKRGLQHDVPDALTILS